MGTGAGAEDEMETVPILFRVFTFLIFVMSMWLSLLQACRMTKISVHLFFFSKDARIHFFRYVYSLDNSFIFASFMIRA